MSTLVKNITFVGASGNLGFILLPYFLAQKNSPKIQVLTRVGSTATFPKGAHVVSTDYSPKSLEKIFKGQDVVLSLLSHDCPLDQKILIDAAVKAGVSRFIPSEYGIRTNETYIHGLVPLAQKKKGLVDHLKKTEDIMNWTAMLSNPWLDFGLIDHLLGFNLEDQTAFIIDGGDVPFSVSTRETVARAVFSLLTNPAAYKEATNQYIHIAANTTTQNQLLKILEKVQGKKWTVEHITSTDLIVQAKDQIAARDMWGVGNLVRALTWGLPFENKSLGDFTSLDPWDKRLNLPKEDLEQNVRYTAEGKYPIIHFPLLAIPE